MADKQEAERGEEFAVRMRVVHAKMQGVISRVKKGEQCSPKRVGW